MIIASGLLFFIVERGPLGFSDYSSLWIESYEGGLNFFFFFFLIQSNFRIESVTNPWSLPEVNSSLFDRVFAPLLVRLLKTVKNKVFAKPQSLFFHFKLKKSKETAKKPVKSKANRRKSLRIARLCWQKASHVLIWNNVSFQFMSLCSRFFCFTFPWNFNCINSELIIVVCGGI